MRVWESFSRKITGKGGHTAERLAVETAFQTTK